MIVRMSSLADQAGLIFGQNVVGAGVVVCF